MVHGSLKSSTEYYNHNKSILHRFKETYFVLKGEVDDTFIINLLKQF